MAVCVDIEGHRHRHRRSHTYRLIRRRPLTECELLRSDDHAGSTSVERQIRHESSAPILHEDANGGGPTVGIRRLRGPHVEDAIGDAGRLTDLPYGRSA